MKTLLIILAICLCLASLLVSNAMTLATTAAVWAVALLQLATLCDRK